MENETRFSRKYYCESRESCEKGKNAIYCKACESPNFKISIDSRESRYEISVCETNKKRVLVIILTRESRENFVPKKRFSLLAKISKSDSLVNPNRKPVRKTRRCYLGEKYKRGTRKREKLWKNKIMIKGIFKLKGQK